MSASKPVRRITRRGIEQEVEALERTRIAVTEISKTIKRRMGKAAEQVALVRQQLDKIAGAPSAVSGNFVLALRGVLAEMEGQEIQLLAEFARARRELESSALPLARMRNTRRLEVTEELRNLSETIARLTIAVEESRRLLAIAGADIPSLEASGTAPIRSMVLIRRAGNRLIRSRVEELSPLMPGDLIQVVIAPAG